MSPIAPSRRFAAGAFALLAAAIPLAACGSEDGFPPPAEPGVAPEQSGEPAGRVIELPNGGEAEGVVADPETGIAAVGTRDPDAIYLVENALDDPKLQRVKVPESARHLQLAEAGGPVLATAERTDDLVQIALPDGGVTTTKVGDFPHDATAAAGKIFVADEGGDTITVVEGDAVAVALPAPEQPGGAAAVGDVVGVIAVAERVLATYDATSLEKTGQIEAGVGPTHIVADPRRDRFYVADTQGDAILVFEAAPEPRLLDRVNLPDKPYGIAFDTKRDRLWVSQTGRNRVVEYEMGDLAPKRVRSYPTVQQPNTVAVDSKTGYVYVAGRANGELQVFDPATAQGSEG